MKIRLEKAVLQTLLDKAVSAVPNKELVPVLRNFQIQANGFLRVTATDLSKTIIAATTHVEVEDKGVAYFPARRLLSIIHLAPEGPISLSTDGVDATIETERTKWTMRLDLGEDFPSLPNLSEVVFTSVDSSVFLNSIRAVRYAAATESFKPSLMLIDFHEGKVRASDSVRLQQITVGDAIPLDFQIPIGVVDDLLRILSGAEDEKIEIGQDDKSIIFRVLNYIFIAQKLNANFPDVDTMLLKQTYANNYALTFKRQELLSAIRRARVTADTDTNAVILTLDNDTILVSTSDKFASTCVEELDAEWQHKDRVIAFNHGHLMDLLHMTGAETVTFKLGKDLKTRPCPVLLEDEETGALGVLNQIRVDWL